MCLIKKALKTRVCNLLDGRAMAPHAQLTFKTWGEWEGWLLVSFALPGLFHDIVNTSFSTLLTYAASLYKLPGGQRAFDVCSIWFSGSWPCAVLSLPDLMTNKHRWCCLWEASCFFFLISLIFRPTLVHYYLEHWSLTVFPPTQL